MHLNLKRINARVAALTAATALLATDSSAAQVTSTTVRRGDTTVVRVAGDEPASATRAVEKTFSFGQLDGPLEYSFGNISGIQLGGDGSVWVFDLSVPALRQYDSTGRFLHQAGRRGAGPGEYSQLIGLAVPQRGGVLVFDPRTSRVHRFGADGKYVNDWQAPVTNQARASGSGVSLRPGVMVDRDGMIYTHSTIQRAGRSGAQPQEISHAFFRFDPDGRIRDTLVVPSLGVRPPSGARGAPAPARTMWVMSPLGTIVGGRTDQYVITILGPRGNVTRVERGPPPTRATPSVRSTSASGAALSDIMVDDDGRIWVQIVVPCERSIDTVEAHTTRGGVRVPAGIREVCVSPPVFEVFSGEGRYLGRVRLPSFVYRPTIRGDAVWLPRRGPDDAPAVTRFRIVPGLPR